VSIHDLMNEAMKWLRTYSVKRDETIPHLGYFVDLNLVRVFFVPVLLPQEAPALVFRCMPEVFDNGEINTFSEDNITEIENLFEWLGEPILSEFTNNERTTHTVVLGINSRAEVRDALDRYIAQGIWDNLSTAEAPNGWMQYV